MDTILTVPGLHGSGPGHWQTWLEARLPGAVRVVQPDWTKPDLGQWAGRVRRDINRVPGRIWVVAHSFGVLAAAQAGWDYRERIAGAMFVAPDDPERFGLERLLPDAHLGFPSLLVASTTDPWMSIESAAQWAETWGSAFVNLGNVGHINVQSGHGAWPQGLDLLARLCGGSGAARRTSVAADDLEEWGEIT